MPKRMVPNVATHLKVSQRWRKNPHEVKREKGQACEQTAQGAGNDKAVIDNFGSQINSVGIGLTGRRRSDKPDNKQRRRAAYPTTDKQHMKCFQPLASPG